MSAKPKWIASAIAVLLLALVASRQMLVGRHQAEGPLLAMPAPAAAPAPMPVQDQPLGISDRKSAAPSARFRGRLICDGVGVPNARVELFAQSQEWRSSRPLAEVRSGNEGWFELSAQTGEATQFIIQASAEGYLTYATRTGVSDTALELFLLRVWTLHGTVRDAETRELVSDVTVDLGKRQAVTDLRGYYRADELRSGEIQFDVRHPEYVVQQLTATIDEEDVRRDIFLQRGQKLAVELVDHETGLPVEEATVNLAGFRFNGGQISSDAKGQFNHHVLFGDQVEVEVQAEGYSQLSWDWQVNRAFEVEFIRLPMLKPGKVKGTVVDDGGAPLYWADIAAEYEPSHATSLSAMRQSSGQWRLPDERAQQYGYPGRCSYQVQSKTHTNPKGQFELEVFPTPIPFTVIATYLQRPPTVSQSLLVESSKTVELDPMELVKGATVRGKIRRNGVAWRGHVRWEGEDGHSGSSMRSDSHGEYEFQGVCPGAIVVQLEGVEPKLSAHRVELTVSSGDEVEHDFIWSEERDVITGIVVNPLNEPVGDALVRAIRVQPTDLPPDSDKTDVQGAFSIEVPAREAFHLEARLGASAASQDGVMAGTKDLRLVLPQLGVLELRLLEEDTRQPLRLSGSAQLGITWRMSGQSVFQRPREMVSIDPEGRTRLNLPLGMIDLRFSFPKDGYVGREVQGISVAQRNEELVLLLSRGTSLSIELTTGSVRDREREGHVFFILAEGQLDQVDGPFLLKGGPSNQSINGVNLWMADPGLINQSLGLVDKEGASIGGLLPGRYCLRSYPNDLVFDPAEIEVHDSGQLSVRVLLRHR